MYFLYIIGSGVLIIALILSFILAKKQQNREIDKTMSAATYKHRVLANPGFIAYASIILIAIVVIGFFMLTNT
ncbi:hypothetical protein ACFPES_25565 [Paenibacillus sp. GCM10023248]|uniref:hypothetical protein n=1 Tax=Bacillales TaxID=1385 RepID=UPI00237840E0|nr:MULTISPECIES: hypothetical protein [Bacillales]MDD9270430.1 hypothetical protein [Paenibacillus sp. MAHUQ-63]MDR6884208.1 heme/copper-type cytochrome/quinol oxidase subunit 2 [Bacillus sp. 3255]